MTARYATYTDVAAELGGVTITAASTPSSSTVDGWLSDSEAEIELLSGQVYATTAISSSDWEYHSYDGSGVIRLNKWPVQSVQLIQYEENGIGADTESWETMTEGYTGSGSFILYKDVGAIKLHGNTVSQTPVPGHQNVRVAYTHGHTSVPRTVKQLATKMAARRYIQSVANESSTTGGGAISVGAISISDPTNYVTTYLSSINKDISDLQAKLVGTLRVVNYDARLYNG